MELQRRYAASGISRTFGQAVAVLAVLAVPSLALADRYACSAMVMYKFTEGVIEKVSDGGPAHQNFLVDTTKGFVRVGANVASMQEFKFENVVAARKNGGWVGILRDATGRYRGALELRDELAFGTGAHRAQKLDFIWSGMIVPNPEYILSGACAFRGQ